MIESDDPIPHDTYVQIYLNLILESMGLILVIIPLHFNQLHPQISG